MTTTPDYAGLEALEQAIIGYWGNRCSDFDGNCPCCQSWKQFDAIRALLERNKELERERDEARRQSDRFCDKYLAALSRAEAAEDERDRLAERVAELEKAAKQAEYCLTKGSLVDAERIDDALSVIRRTARSLVRGGGDE